MDRNDIRMKEYWSQFGDVQLVELQSKHLPPEASSPELEVLREQSKAVGYQYSEMGNHQKLSPDLDRFYVHSLSKLAGFRPIKIVIEQDCRLWADNTHWTLAALLRFGLGARLKDVPCYFVDMRTDKPLIINRPDTLIGRSQSAVITNAENIIKRLAMGWRTPPLSFTIGELFALGRYEIFPALATASIIAKR